MVNKEAHTTSYMVEMMSRSPVDSFDIISGMHNVSQILGK